MLEAVGINVEYTYLAFDANIMANLLAAPTYLMSMSSNLSGWTDIQNVAAPTAVMNGFRTETAEFNALMDEIQNSSGEQQVSAYHAANRYLVEQAWFMPIVALNGVYFTSATVDCDMQPGQIVPSLRNHHPHTS
jgi:peptide/nickel transport system substrate-binding protein